MTRCHRHWSKIMPNELAAGLFLSTLILTALLAPLPIAYAAQRYKAWRKRR